MSGDQIGVLFLDIDGVLNSGLFFTQISAKEETKTTAEERVLIKKLLPHTDLPPGAKNEMSIRIDLRHLDPRAIKRLNQVTRRPDVRVVVSSTWRHGYKVQGLQMLLESRGFVGKVIGKTRELWGQRGDEIQDWLNNHAQELALQGYTCPPFPGSVRSVAIFDDDSDMGTWRPRHVKVDNRFGLRPCDIERALALLEDPIG